jgi:hemoglobin
MESARTPPLPSRVDTPPAPHTALDSRCIEPTRADIARLVDTFYGRIRQDALLGPVFGAALDGRWEQHMPKMVDFWSSLVLGEKTYQGNVKAVHQPLPDLQPEHFRRWLSLFIATVDELFDARAAMRFAEPALRIAHSLQLSRFGWDFKLPAEQTALLAAMRRQDEAADHGRAGADRPSRESEGI